MQLKLFNQYFDLFDSELWFVYYKDACVQYMEISEFLIEGDEFTKLGPKRYSRINSCVDSKKNQIYMRLSKARIMYMSK